MNKYNFFDYEESAEYIKKQLNPQAEIAIVFGTGLSTLADKIENVKTLAYDKIPHFEKTTVPSHRGIIYSGTLFGKDILALSGKNHCYEGHTPETSAFYVGVLKLLGIKTLIITNAAGAVNITDDFELGDFMLIKDHINFSAKSPMAGDNIPQLGDKFFDMSDTYTAKYRQMILENAKKAKFKLNEGVYFYMSGPQFETPAEIRAIKNLGGDAVGMSTVFEAIASAHCQIKVVGVSCLTNLAAGITKNKITSEEVTDIGEKSENSFSDLIKIIIHSIS